MSGTIAPGPTAARPPFRFSASTRVGFDETDAQGVVYYGRYMPYFDRARVEYMRMLGILGGEPGHEFVMRANRVEYHAPARFDDLLEVFARVERIGTSSVIWHFAAYGPEGTLLCTAEQTLVQIERAARRPITVGAAIRSAVASFKDATLPRVPPDRNEALVAAVGRIVESLDEADEILRRVVAEVARKIGGSCGVRFVEDGELVLGPAGGGDPTDGRVVPVRYDGAHVADLLVTGASESDVAALAQVADLIADYCLVGWDIGGEAWQP